MTSDLTSPLQTFVSYSRDFSGAGPGGGGRAEGGCGLLRAAPRVQAEPPAAAALPVTAAVDVNRKSVAGSRNITVVIHATS